MTPYYQDEWATIYCGDCLLMMPFVRPVELVFTDPPYNSGLDYGEGTDDSRADYWEWLGARMDSAMAVADTMVVKHSALKIGAFLERHPARRVMVWYKPFSSGFPLYGIATHWEPLYLLKGKALRWTKDVIEVSAGNTNAEASTGHPAQFPEELARRIVSVFSEPGDTVLDPFMGSGTVVRAAKDLGRKSIGIEIEERYCEIAAQRLSQGVLDLGAA